MMLNKAAIRETLEKYDYAMWRVMEAVRETGRRIHQLYFPHSRDSMNTAYEYAQFIIEIIDRAREVSDER
jgi:hypothetical protein